MGREYSVPAEIEVEALRRRAARRRVALAAAGCATYEIGQRGGEQAIVCLCCGLGSNNSSDVAERYCGFCAEWHSEWGDDPL